MQENDFNIIKSMESLPTIGTSPKYRQAKKKKQNTNNQQERKITDDQINESIEQDADSKVANNDQHCIDYRA